MKKKKLLIKRKGKQHGISLVVSLIMLLIMTVIGISAMNTSISKLKMTTGIQQQSAASNITDESLNFGEGDANLATNNNAAIINNSGFSIGPANFNDPNIWNNAFTDANGGNYIIEFLGRRVQEGGSLDLDNQDTPGDRIFVFRITSRVNNNNTTRMLESLFVTEAPPSGSVLVP